MKEKREERDFKRPDANPDPITGAPGAHPIGTGVGAASGGAAGAAIGAAVGGPVGAPIGAVVGAVVGGVAGGLAGKGAAEALNPTTEDAYWRENYKTRPYVESEAPYETYRPAYEYGWTARSRYAGKNYGEVEADLERGWETVGATCDLDWDKARPATRDAWDRVERNRRNP